MAFSENEKDELREQILRDLADEHQRRITSLEKKKDRSRRHNQTRNQRERDIELYDMQEKLREEFYRQNQYREYTDSAGRVHMLPPEEYDWRMRARKRRVRKTRMPREFTYRTRNMALYGLVCFLAVIAGLILTRAG